jgi:hypothetical protein
VIPEKLSDGAALKLAVAVEPENVSFHVATADAASVLRCIPCGAGAPAAPAAIVTVTPAGHVAPVTSAKVPAIPFDGGNAALAVLFGGIVVDALVALDDALDAGLGFERVGTDVTAPPPPQPETTAARRTSDPAQFQRLGLIYTRPPKHAGSTSASEIRLSPRYSSNE